MALQYQSLLATFVHSSKQINDLIDHYPHYHQNALSPLSAISTAATSAAMSSSNINDIMSLNDEVTSQLNVYQSLIKINHPLNRKQERKQTIERKPRQAYSAKQLERLESEFQVNSKNFLFKIV